MATFPALEPATRGWDMGSFPVTMQSAWGTSPMAFSHGSQPTAHKLTLTYQLISATEAATLRTHYRTQRGGLLPFTLPAVIWLNGVSIGPGQWRYAGPPQETHRNGGLVDVSIELQAVLA
jgi:hypothetical protein